MRTFSLLLISCIYISCFSQQYSEKWTDINYVNDEKIYHKLDIYLPEIVKAKYPIIIYIYGSAWFSNNSKGSDMNTVGAALLNAGYAVVTPNHRSSSDSLFPAQIQDIKAVIRYVRENCQTYNLDTTFIGIAGSSSGGHLAALAGTSGGIFNFTFDTITMDMEGNLGGNNNFSSNIHAVCDWFGPTDLLLMDSCRGSMAYAEGQSPEEILIGCSKKDCNSKFVFLNPITFIDPSDPPFLIFHGDADNVVPYCESQLLYDALQEADVSVEFNIIPGGQHYTGTHTTENFVKMISFFNGISNNNITGITKNTKENRFDILLNSSKIQLISKNLIDEQFHKYKIIDISGKLIEENYIYNNEISISNLANGLYFLQVQLKDGVLMINKFIKS